MRLHARFVVFGVLTVTASLLALAACVGDDPAASGVPGVDASFEASPIDTDSGGPATDAGTDAANPVCATATGKFATSGTLGFYGSHHGVAATSDGWAFAGFYRKAASYDDGGTPLGDGGDPTESASVARLDKSGNVVWQQSFGGTSSDEFSAVTVDDKDNVYVAGWFESASFDIGATPVTNPQPNAALGVVIKLDAATGNPLWFQTFVPGTFGYGCGAIDWAAGHLVVACSMGQSQQYRGAGGATQSLASNQVMASAVYSLDPATGDALWADSFSTPAGTNTSYETAVESIDVTDATVVVAGTFGGGTLTDKTAVQLGAQGGMQTGFVAELTVADGHYHFAKAFGSDADGGTIQNATAAGSSLDGGVFVGGSFQGTISFGGTPHTSVSGSLDAYLVWLANKAGAPDWEDMLGGTNVDSIRAVRIDPCGRPEVMLNAGSDLGKRDGVTFPAPQNGPASIVAKFSPSGMVLWASGFANGGNADLNGINAWGFGIDPKSGATRSVGDFRGQIDFGSGTVSVGPSGSNPFFVEYAP